MLSDVATHLNVANPADAHVGHNANHAEIDLWSNEVDFKPLREGLHNIFELRHVVAKLARGVDLPEVK